MLFSGRWHSDKNEKILPLDRQSYQVTFSAKTENQYPAIGLFTRSQGQAYGTFLTETGDYRFLEGERNGDSLWLSCFDGIHLFLFNAQFSNTDSLISGTFHSGKNWFEPWVGTLNNEPQLNHPDSITRFMAKEGTLLEFEVMDRQGIRRFFNAEDWIGKVSIIQVMGSWCPNCLDESRYLQELITKLDSKEVQLIPVAFERKGNVAEQVNAIEHFENLLGSGPITYIGGLASKTEASSVFNQLNNISSFPTTIFLDKKGVLRKIHTGFYGPGTGKYYERYKTSTEHFVRQLLSETEEKTW
jgi:thiol-disulfide isomerase/thioredoxin